MKIKIKKLKKEVQIPKYAHPGDAGLDLFSLVDYELKPGERKIFDLGFALEFVEGYVALVKDKGGLSKFGLHTIGGVFDAGYRGEFNVNLINLSDKSYKINKGDKIAQLIVIACTNVEFEEADSLTSSSRGEGRWGSTGK